MPENKTLILPLINMTSKGSKRLTLGLTVNGVTHGKQSPSQRIKEEMERFGWTIDSKYRHKYQSILPLKALHLEHKSWCNWRRSNCTCLLINHSAPQQVWVRIEATPLSAENQLNIARLANDYGEYSFLATIEKCHQLQRRQFTSEDQMIATLTYPIIDTAWNRGKGIRACFLHDGIPQVFETTLNKNNSMSHKESDQPATSKNIPTFYGIRRLETNPKNDDMMCSFPVEKGAHGRAFKHGKKLPRRVMKADKLKDLPDDNTLSVTDQKDLGIVLSDLNLASLDDALNGEVGYDEPPQVEYDSVLEESAISRPVSKEGTPRNIMYHREVISREIHTADDGYELGMMSLYQ